MALDAQPVIFAKGQADRHAEAVLVRDTILIRKKDKPAPVAKALALLNVESAMVKAHRDAMLVVERVANKSEKLDASCDDSHIFMRNNSYFSS